MVGWHHRLNGHEFEQALGVGDGQGSLAYCSPWSCKESDMTEQLNWTEQGLVRLWRNLNTPTLLITQTFVRKVMSLLFTMLYISSVQLLSHVWLFVTPWAAAPKASLSITNSQSLLKLMSIKSVMPSNHLILFHPLLLPPSIFPSIRVFSNESVLCIMWPKYWSFSFSISPFNEYSGLISFRMGWLDLPAVQGTLKSLLQHHNSKASIL